MPTKIEFTDEDKVNIYVHFNNSGLRETARQFQVSPKVIKRIVDEFNERIRASGKPIEEFSEEEKYIRRSFSDLVDELDLLHRSLEMAMSYAELCSSEFYELPTDKLTVKLNPLSYYLMLVEESLNRLQDKIEDILYSSASGDDDQVLETASKDCSHI